MTSGARSTVESARSTPTATTGEARPRPRDARFVVGIAVGLIVLQTVLRAWTCLRGWFYIDDFAFTGRAMEYHLLDPAYLLHTYNSHVMPGAWVWVWVTTRLFPMEWAPVAIAMLVLQLALAVLVLRLLVDMFGPRPLILPPLAIALLSPITLPASVWWAAALNQLPQQLALAGGLLALVRYLRTGSRRAALAGPVILVGGLLFSEKSLFLVPLIVALVLVYTCSGGLLVRVRESCKRDRLLWTGYAVVALLYLVGYVGLVPSPIRTTAMAGHDLLELLMVSIFHATVPGVVGGPLTWQAVGFAGALAFPSALVVGAAVLLVGAVVAATVALQRGAARAWVILAGYLLVNLVLLSRSRATVIGPVIGTEYRYQTDVALVAAVMLGLATMSVLARFPHAAFDPLRPRPEVHARLEASVLTPLADAHALPVNGLMGPIASVGTAIVVVGSVASTLAYDSFWVNNPAKPWYSSVRTELEGLPTGTRLTDSFVPQYVAWGFVYPYNESFHVLSPILAERQTLTPGAIAERVVAPDDGGHLRLVVPTGATAGHGPAKGCGYRVGTKPVTIQLDADAAQPLTLVRVGFATTAATRLVVTAGGRSSSLPVTAGLRTAYVAVDGPVETLTLRSTASGAAVCTDDVTAGSPVLIPGSTP